MDVGADAQQYQQQLMQCMQHELQVAACLHHVACQEVSLLRDKQDHEQQYHAKDEDERRLELKRRLHGAQMEAEQLKLDGLRQRKQVSILRLKLASAKEDAELMQRNVQMLDQLNQRLKHDLAALTGQLADATQQLINVSADRAAVATECAQYQAQAVLYETEAMQLREELKQTAGRLNHANSQTADLLQQLRAQQAENASLLGQVAQSHGRDTEAASAHRALQEALDRMTREHARLKQRLEAEELARVAAETAAAKARAAAEAAQDTLAVKEQQLAGWRDLEQASKAAATQQLQMSQTQLDSMRDRATAAETKLLDQIAAMQQQLEQERAARCALEARRDAASGQAAAEQGVLGQELAAVRAQLAKVQKELGAAQAKAKREGKRASDLALELEQQHEANTRDAVQVVGQLVEGLTQAPSDTEEEGSEQPPAAPRQVGAAAKKAAAGAAAAAGRRKPPPASAVAAGAGAAALSGITEGDEGAGDDASDHEQQQQQQQQQHLRPAAAQLGRVPRGAKQRAQEGIKAAAAAIATPPAGGAGGGGATPGSAGSSRQEQQHSARKGPSPNTRSVSRNALLEQQQNSQLQPGSSQQQPATQAKQPAARGAAGSSCGPAPLSFVPRSVTTPATALQQPGVVQAAAERVSAADMLRRLGQGNTGHNSKPGARKRKLGVVGNSGAGEAIPAALLMSTGFKPPKVRHAG